MSSLKNKTATAFAWDLLGLLGSQGTSFVISIVLARLLEPEEFGLIGMVLVFMSITQVFLDVGFTSALIQNKNNTDLTYSSVFFFNLFAGIMLTVCFYFSASFIGDFYQNDKIADVARLLSFIFFINSLNLVQTAILQRKLNFKVLTLRNLIATLIGGIFGVFFAFQGYGVFSLVIQQLTAAIIGTVLLWSISGWKPNMDFSMSELKNLIGFSTYVFVDRFISTIFQKLDIMLIGKIFSPATLGFYVRAVTLQGTVASLSSASLSKIFFPVLSQLQSNHKEYSRIYFKVISVVSFLSFGLTGILYLLGQDIIIGLFGEKWMPSVEIFQVLVLTVCTHPLNSMMVNAFMSKGKSRENFQVGIFRKTIRIIPLVIAYLYGIFYFIIAVVVCNYFLTVTNILFLKKYTSLSISQHFRKIFEGMIPLLIVLIIFHIFNFDTAIERVLLTMSFMSFYLLFCYFIKVEGLSFLLKNVITYIRK